MLSFCRRLTRPFTLVLLVLLLAPAAVDCCELTASHGEGRACCLKPQDDGAKLDADCCAIEQSPANQQAPGSTPVTAGKVTPTAAPLLAAEWAPVPTQTVHLAVAEAVRPPADPLYLRLSTLRR
jgi:hypothetical protein